jgi:exopolysaccharide production protein ExoY
VGGTSKRSVDVLLAVVALLLLVPLFLAVAAMIKLSGGGPVLYSHRRVGCNGKTFGCLKFRTMVEDSDTVLKRYLAANPAAAAEWQSTRKLKHDPRVTPLGAVLRKTSVDELPQLINVLRGEMSLVGPRPISAEEIAAYGAKINDYFAARPGLTGVWQVSGRNNVAYEHRVALDSDYVQNWSLGRDVVIIARTIPAVLKADGCY